MASLPRINRIAAYSSVSAMLREAKAKFPADCYFLSAEWRSWSACRKPKEAHWDGRQKLLAGLQRNLAKAYGLQAVALAHTKGSGCHSDVRALENEVREVVRNRDARSET